MNPLVKKLLDSHKLSSQESKELFCGIIAGELSDVELTAGLIALKFRGETHHEIAGAASALISSARPFPIDGEALADNCGTGGDGLHTINISTAAAVIAACAGVKMVKHGNRSVSSKCGSADVLESLGININTSPAGSKACLDQVGICFLFAPLYHQGIKHAMPVRRSLQTRTVFNLLGPLVNPARPQFQLLGIYDPAFGKAIALALLELGTKKAMVVHGSGMDELCLDGPNQIWLVENGQVTEKTIDASSLGLESYSRDLLKGGEPAFNANTLRQLFAGQGTLAQQHAVALNAGAIIWLAGKSESWRLGVQLALKVLGSNDAETLIQRWSEVSHGAK